MATNPLTSTSQAASLPPAPKSTQSLGKLADNFDDFLQLLVTQLQNQDPTAPLDTNDFTNQIVQFTNVEQQINTNKNLEQLISLSKLSQTSNLVSFAGKQVQVESNNITLEQQGSVPFSFSLKEPGKQAFVTVRDDTDSVVFTGALPSASAGKHASSWDGTDLSGERLPPGYYKLFVTVDMGEGIIETVPIQVAGRVSGVNLQNEDPSLIVNGKEIPLSEVKFIGA